MSEEDDEELGRHTQSMIKGGRTWRTGGMRSDPRPPSANGRAAAYYFHKSIIFIWVAGSAPAAIGLRGPPWQPLAHCGPSSLRLDINIEFFCRRSLTLLFAVATPTAAAGGRGARAQTATPRVRQRTPRTRPDKQRRPTSLQFSSVL